MTRNDTGVRPQVSDRSPGSVTVATARPGLGYRVPAVGGIDEVYALVGADLFGFVAGMVRNPAIAEDLVQEAFTRLLREERRGRYPDNPRAWLYTVATNLVRGRARRQGFVERFLRVSGRSPIPETDEAAEDVVMRREQATELADALASLGAESRAALLLAAEGFPGKEIATMLGRSEGATRNLMWRARLALRELLEEPTP
jgi:RNA polymerase sigma-70 factor (ECF subfamily)